MKLVKRVTVRLGDESRDPTAAATGFNRVSATRVHVPLQADTQLETARLGKVREGLQVSTYKPPYPKCTASLSSNPAWNIDQQSEPGGRGASMLTRSSVRPGLGSRGPWSGTHLRGSWSGVGSLSRTGGDSKLCLTGCNVCLLFGAPGGGGKQRQFTAAFA